MKTFIAISEKGEIETFQGDFPWIEETITSPKTERVSHVYPKSLPLRIFFKLLRKIFSDNGLVADWTRKWKCEWIVIMRKPEKLTFGPFKTRKEAIEFERNFYVQVKRVKPSI